MKTEAEIRDCLDAGEWVCNFPKDNWKVRRAREISIDASRATMVWVVDDAGCEYEAVALKLHKVAKELSEPRQWLISRHTLALYAIVAALTWVLEVDMSESSLGHLKEERRCT